MDEVRRIRVVFGDVSVVMTEGEAVELGRGSRCGMRVTSEPALSRRHAVLRCVEGGLHVRTDEAAANRFYVDGESQNDNEFTLPVGGSAVLGASRLTVTDADPQPLRTMVLRTPPTESMDRDRRLSVLGRLPNVVRLATSDRERDDAVAALLLVGIPAAEAAVVVDGGEVVAWRRRRETAGTPVVSTRLVREALDRGQTVLHEWAGAPGGDADATPDYTQAASTAWALCVPWEGTRALYLAGDDAHRLDESSLRLEAKFVEVVTELLRSVDAGRQLEGRVAQLRQFLSPPVLAAVEAGGSDGAALLEPRETELVVLLADLRGFSGEVEVAGDLLAALDDVRRALEVMTGAVLSHGGVTGEFLGDAVLGFWGWPIEGEDIADRACAAALEMRAKLDADRVGLGITMGRAVAGRIVTGDRTSINVFGPAVNLASRLQGLTKPLRAAIVVDAAVRERATAHRFRSLGRVVPYGLSEAVAVSELLPEDGLGDDAVREYEAAVASLVAGDWADAHARLMRMPPEDRAGDFLRPLLARHDRTPPAGWDGAVKMDAK